MWQAAMQVVAPECCLTIAEGQRHSQWQGSWKYDTVRLMRELLIKHVYMQSGNGMKRFVAC